MDLLIGRSIDRIDKINKKNGSEDRIERIVTLVGAKKKDGLVDRIDIDPGGLEDQWIEGVWLDR